MSVKLSDKETKSMKKPEYNWRMLALFPVWVTVAFIISNVILIAFIVVARYLHVPIPSADNAVFGTVLAAALYALTLTITIGLPWRLSRKRVTTKKELGLTRLPNWMDLALAPAGAVLYIILAVILMAIFTALFPLVDMNQAQDVGFNNLSFGYEYVLAFITLIILAPIAEETLFRGYLYGKLRKYVPFWAAMLVTSALFGLAHGQWNLAINTFALSLVLCSLREITDSIWAGVLLHMIKNGVAFYLIFVSPHLLTGLGG
jgi:membrane protease YdiL (CAAX protease family)